MWAAIGIQHAKTSQHACILHTYIGTLPNRAVKLKSTEGPRCTSARGVTNIHEYNPPLYQCKYLPCDAKIYAAQTRELISWTHNVQNASLNHMLPVWVFKNKPLKVRSLDSPVGTATSYGLARPGSIPGSYRFFSSPQRPDRLWDTHILLYIGYRWAISPRGKAAGACSWPLTSTPHMSSWHHSA
jgi:hypothetical protein